MEQDILLTPDAVIEALGGTAETGRITGQAPATVSNWKARKRISPEHFLVIKDALEANGKSVAPEVFGIRGGEAA